MNQDNGGPAFPVQDMSKWQVPGLTLRDYFAAKAIGYTVDHCTTYSRSAEEAYKMADAMLEVRK